MNEVVEEHGVLVDNYSAVLAKNLPTGNYMMTLLTMIRIKFWLA